LLCDRKREALPNGPALTDVGSFDLLPKLLKSLFPFLAFFQVVTEPELVLNVLPISVQLPPNLAGVLAL
jgi:hypothetical protein